MSMTVDASVNGEPIRKLLIQNVTEKAAGVNTYRWTCYRWTYADKTPDSKGILSIQQGRIEHVMEDGAMVLISKVAQAASETETSA